MLSSNLEPSLYIFGYGSLLWNPSFPYVTSSPGYIIGYYRRLWQLSTDHRGTPEKPGRVFTLIPANLYAKLPHHSPEMLNTMNADGKKKAIVWGIVYGVSEEDKAKVLEELDYREKDGYGRTWEDVYDANGKVIARNALFYSTTKELGIPKAGDGVKGWKEIAQAVVNSRGESGMNWEYVMKGRDAVRRLGVVDGHLEGVAKEVTALRALD